MCIRDRHCLGHLEPRRISVADYRKEQGLEEYDELARGWRQLILKKKSSGPSIGKPTKRSLELFFMACYDLDRFSQFVASEGFSNIYDLPPESLRNILLDDVELLQFAFRLLRQVLFGEETIPLRREAADERRLRLQDRKLRLEAEAAARRAAEQDGMYENPDSGV